MLVARSPHWRECRQTQSSRTADVWSRSSVFDYCKELQICREHTCSWKTVIGASCSPALQSYMCHVIFDRAAG